MTNANTEPCYRWPDDYVSLGRHMMVRPDCIDGFRELGWITLEQLMVARNVDVVRQLEARDNCKVSIPTNNGSIDGFLKRHRVRTVRHWFLEGRRHRAAKVPGMAEAGAVQWCQEAGVPTVSIIAAGTRPGRRRWCSDSLFMSEALHEHKPANEFWFPAEQRKSPPDGFATDINTRRKVLKSVATTARKFHEAGLFHFDFYLEHFFLNLPQDTTAKLIDLQRVERHARGPGRWRAMNKDLSRFLRSCQRYQLSSDEIQLWKRHYLDGSEDPSQIGAFDKLRFHAARGRVHLRNLKRRKRKRAA